MWRCLKIKIWESRNTVFVEGAGSSCRADGAHSPAQRGLGFASFMIADFARGRLEGERILISPTVSAEETKPRLQAGSEAVGQTWPAATAQGGQRRQ